MAGVARLLLLGFPPGEAERVRELLPADWTWEIVEAPDDGAANDLIAKGGFHAWVGWRSDLKPLNVARIAGSHALARLGCPDSVATRTPGYLDPHTHRTFWGAARRNRPG